MAMAKHPKKSQVQALSLTRSASSTLAQNPQTWCQPRCQGLETAFCEEPRSVVSGSSAIRKLPTLRLSSLTNRQVDAKRALRAFVSGDN
jgi:hypothetical protein